MRRYLSTYCIAPDDARHIFYTFSRAMKEGQAVLGPHSTLDLILDKYDALRAGSR